jgi:ketosteroid isomerase-like protein
MASATLDLVRSICAAWEQGDYSSTGWAHPEIEFTLADGPDPASSMGMAGMVDYSRSFLSAWEDVRAKVEEYRELDDERVLVLVEASARGKASGLEVGQMRTTHAILFHLRDGQVTRLVLYWDCGRAFADLGLAPDVAPGDSPRARVDVWREDYEGWARDS